MHDSGGVLRIGALAHAASVTPDTIRYYERTGLLAPPARSAGGFRLYGTDAVERLVFIKRAQALGLALDEIRQLVGFDGTRGLSQCREVQPLLRTRLAELDARLRELRALRRSLSQSLQACEQRLAAHPDADCPVVAQLEQADSARRTSRAGRGGAPPTRRPGRTRRRR